MSKQFLSYFKSASAAALLLAVVSNGAHADSLWKDDVSRPLHADKKARAVGDILTILIQESNGSSRQNTTTTAKKSSVDAGISSFLYGPAASGLLTKGGSYPALKANSATDFTGGGQINNSETITAKLSVQVIDVQPNGNLMIEGRRQTSFSGEKMDAILHGVVRSDDILANNTVFSYNLADATIQYVGKGTLSDNQKKGWFSRIWDKVSPF